MRVSIIKALSVIQSRVPALPGRPVNGNLNIIPCHQPYDKPVFIHIRTLPLFSHVSAARKFLSKVFIRHALPFSRYNARLSRIFWFDLFDLSLKIKSLVVENTVI
jgi:hypothetical protein